MKQELGPNQKRWIEALESGEYAQTCEVLRDADGFCCLGVAVDVLAPERWTGSGDVFTVEGDDDDPQTSYSVSLPESLVDELAMHGREGHVKDDPDGYESMLCSAMNDQYRMSFAEIARVLRRDAHLYFKEPR